jgi:hypothetical protein
VTTGRLVQVVGPEADEFFLGELVGPDVGTQDAADGQGPGADEDGSQDLIVVGARAPTQA